MSPKELSQFDSSRDAYQPLEDETPSQNSAMTDDSGGKCKKVLVGCGAHLKSLKIEVVALLFMFSATMTRITSTNLILDKVCLVHLEYPHDICGNLDLDNYTDIKTEVVKVTSNYGLGRLLIEIAPAAVFSSFMAPWSDRYGRRFPILIAVFGMILDAAGSTVCAYFLESRVEYYFIPAIFTGAFGGTISVMAVVYAYGSDVTTIERRTLKYAFIAMYAGLSMAFGSMTGGWIYNFWGYPPVFVFSAVGLCLCALWVMLVVPETRGKDNRDSWLQKIKSLYSCDTLKESFTATTKKRPHQGRKQLSLLIVSMCCLIIAQSATDPISYLFVRRQFGWGNTKYSTLTAIYSAIGIVAYLIVVPLLTYFRASDPQLGLIGTVSFLAKNIGIGIAYKTGIYHVASVLGLLGGISCMAGRSRISKVVSADDLGKIFSFVASAEAFSPILASVPVTQIFRETVDIYPGTAYIAVSSVLIVPLIVFIWMTRLPRMTLEDIKECVNHDVDISSTVDRIES